jgi:hypothetical protein
VVAALQVIYVVIGLAQVTVGFGLGRHDPGVSVRSLAAMVWAVIADLPRFLTSPLYRRWHRRWGATQEELTGAMPGDALLPHSAYSATRAISIPAAPETVWAWLVQVGADRAGWYSDDLLDHAGQPSSRTLVPEWQGSPWARWSPCPGADPLRRAPVSRSPGSRPPVGCCGGSPTPRGAGCSLPREPARPVW